MTMGDFDFHPVNFALGLLAGVVVVVVVLTTIRLMVVSGQHRDERVKVARMEACGAITDESLRAICVVTGEKP